MEKRSFPHGGEAVSLLGFGCMRFPTTGKVIKKIDAKKSAEMIDYAYNHGVNYYDTAYMYHMGKSETFIGPALHKYPRESYYLADKLPTWLIFKEEDVEKYFRKQLEKCGVEYFDFYLVHCLTASNYKKVKKYKIYENLVKLKEKGLIRHIGFSFHDKPALLKEIVDDYNWDFAQIQLNYLDWELLDAKSQYEILKEKGVPIVIMEPVRGGKLATLCPDAVKILKDASPDASPASWALRYAASFPEVFTVLSGMSEKEQVEDNVKTFSEFKPLDESERNTLANALAVFKKVDSVFCTGCRYCMDCPFGVDIPKVFAVYKSLAVGSKEDFLKEYNAMDVNARADKCRKCDQCASKCPQQIKISEIMGKIAQAVSEM